MTEQEGPAIEVANGSAVEPPNEPPPVDEVSQGASDEGRPLIPTSDPPEDA